MISKSTTARRGWVNARAPGFDHAKGALHTLQRAGLLGLCLASVSACSPRVDSDSGNPPAGTEGGVCRSDGGCDAKLSCLSRRCVELPAPGNATGGASSVPAGAGNAGHGGRGGPAGGQANGNDAGASGSGEAGDAGSGDASFGGTSAGTGGTSAGTGGTSGGSGGSSAGAGGTIGGSGGSSAGTGGTSGGPGGSGAGTDGAGVGGSPSGGANGGVGGVGGVGGCIAALAPHVQFIAPYVALSNRATSLIVRGVALNAGAPLVTVNIGGTRVGPLAADSDTQITVQVPPLPAGHYPVSVEGGGCSSGTDAELLVQPPPALEYRAISAPSKRERLIWDSERQTLYAVNRTDQEIERYRYAESSWTTLAPYVVPDLTDIALAPNGRSLIISTRGAILEGQLGQATFVTLQSAVNPDTFCGGYFNQLTMANDGTVFVIFDLAQCSGFTSSYLYDMRDHSLTKNPYFVGYLYNGLAGGSLDGSRIYAGSNGVSPAQQIKIFNPLTHEVVDASPSYNLGAVSVSSNASRVILQNVDVYSRALSLTGHLPSNAVALASLDSSRAFVYGETGAESQLVVRDLNGVLEAGALYPMLKAVDLPDSPSSGGSGPFSFAMASLQDDSTVFLSGDRNILVVPVN